MENSPTEKRKGKVISVKKSPPKEVDVPRGAADLAVLVEAITASLPTVTHEQARDAVNKILSNYEEQLTTFVVGVAKAKLGRVLRLMQIIDTTEDELTRNDTRIKCAETKDLLRLWSIAQAGLTTDVSFIKDVVELRAKLSSYQKPNPETVVNILGVSAQQAAESVSDFPSLSPQGREKVRNVIESFIKRASDDDT